MDGVTDYVVATLGHTVSTTALLLTDLGFTATQIAKAHSVLITVNTNTLIWRADGTAPTASVGHYIPALGSQELFGKVLLQNLKLIRQGGSDATITASLIGSSPLKGAMS